MGVVMNLNRIVEIIKQNTDFSGVIQIVENNRIKLHIASGYAKRADLLLNQLDTSFGIASGTKGFTALGIMKLIEAGKLTLDTDVFSVLPFEFKLVKEPVTVQQLMSHTSGIYDYYDEDKVENFGQLFEQLPISKILGPKDMLPLLITGEPYFKPGEKFKYCNSGFVILAMLIEEVSGMSYKAYLEEEVIKPLGLTGTGCYKTNQLPLNSAHGFLQDDQGQWYSNIFEIPMVATGDGGLYTCAEDIAKMWTGLIKGDFLIRELVHQLFEINAKIPWSDHLYYGLGFYRQHDASDQLKNYFLVGEDPGVSFATNYYPKEDRIITILGNTTEGVWDLLKIIGPYID